MSEAETAPREERLIAIIRAGGVAHARMCAEAHLGGRNPPPQDPGTKIRGQAPVRKS